MFDIAPSELLLVAVVALLVIGPKDLPLALRTGGRWLGKVRRMSNHFRLGVETMIREAELAEIEQEWRERNARIMAEHPDAEGLDAAMAPAATTPVAEPVMEPVVPPAPLDAATAEAALMRQPPTTSPKPGPGESELPPRKPARKRRT